MGCQLILDNTILTNTYPFLSEEERARVLKAEGKVGVERLGSGMFQEYNGMGFAVWCWSSLIGLPLFREVLCLTLLWRFGMYLVSSYTLARIRMVLVHMVGRSGEEGIRSLSVFIHKIYIYI